MTTSAGISNLKSKVEIKKGALRSRNNAVASDSTKISSSWKGEISVLYKDAYKRIQPKVSRLIDDLGSLASKLNALANAVNKAAGEEKKVQK